MDAALREVPRVDLGGVDIEAAGGDLNAYMLAELDRTVAREVEDRVAQDVH